jgi:hypothetical protein
MDGSEPVIACRDGVPPFSLEIVQERGDERGVEVGEVKVARPFCPSVW